MPRDATSTPKSAVPLPRRARGCAKPSFSAVHGVAALLLVASLMTGCDVPAPSVVPTQDEQPAAAAPAAGSGKEVATVAVLRRLDKLRSENFNPGIELPRQPEPSPTDPNVTAFAASEATKAYESQTKQYEKQMVGVRRALDKYVKEFERDWGQTNGPMLVGIDNQKQAAKKKSLLTTAIEASGGMPAQATCFVLGIEGRCEQVCMRFYTDIGLQQVALRACEISERQGFAPGTGVPYRAQACSAAALFLFLPQSLHLHCLAARAPVG